MCLVSSVRANLLFKLSNTSVQGTFSNKAFKTESSMWIVIPVPVPEGMIFNGIVDPPGGDSLIFNLKKMIKWLNGKKKTTILWKK